MVDSFISKFAHYFDDIKLSSSVRSRIDELVSDLVDFLGEEPVDLILKNKFKDDVESFDNMWIFTENFASEIRNFIKSDVFDAVSRDRAFFHIEIKIEKGRLSDIENAGNVLFEAHTMPMLLWRFEAHGRNAFYVREIFIKYVKSNLSSLQG